MVEPHDLYAAKHNIQIVRRLGMGKDGTVYETDRLSALKVHERVEAYCRERDAYLRLQERAVTQVLQVRVPSLWNFDDELRIIEMSIVKPPFLLDFASVWLDKPPDFPAEAMDEWQEQIRERFDDRFSDVLALLDTLAQNAGIYMYDVHSDNLKFE